MQMSKAPVSLADLHAAGIHLRADEAVSLVRELIRQVGAGEVVGVPSAHVIRLADDGRLSVEGPVAAGEPSVVRAAQLLEALVHATDQSGPARVPGGLKLVVARGLRTLDLPPFGSLAEFAQALERFAAGDPAAVVASLVARARAARAADHTPVETGAPGQGAQVEPFAPVDTVPVRAGAVASTLTISDIRRARRAAGVSLADVAERSGIPMGLLRQLEWGYLLNWPAAPQGRHLLVRYARASGLDEQLVVATVLPLVEQMTSLRALFASSQTAGDSLAPARRAEGLVERPVNTVRPASHRRRSGGLAWIAAAALLVASVPAAWFALSLDMPDGRQAVVERDAEAPQPSATGTGGDVAPAEEQAPTAAEPAATASAGMAETAGEVSAPVPQPADAERAVASPPSSRAPARVEAALNGSQPALSGGAPGTAMFYEAEADETSALGGSGARPGSATLRVTRIVDGEANHSHVRPSPDGRSIAFDSDRHGERAVYVADVDGRNVQRVSPEGFAAMPNWSPDGRSLAFVRAEPDTPDVWNLWTLDRETGALRQITRRTAGRTDGGSWLPTGDGIVYSLADRLVVHDLRTGSEREYASPRTGRPVRSPVASPDGRRVVFHVLRDGTWLLDLTDGSMRRVLDDPTANAYTWSPDGTQLAYHSARSGGWGLWVMGPRSVRN
jgi:cytoskeletal protein RodZ